MLSIVALWAPTGTNRGLEKRMLSENAAQVDHSRDPSGQEPKHFHGIAAGNQIGNPASMGFGVLPVQGNLHARQAMWW